MSTGASILGAEIFAAGNHRGEYYSLRDLDDMARNHNLARGIVDNPLVIGHEEDQPLSEGVIPAASLKNTGIPAMGWATRVWRSGLKLLADFADVPAIVANAIAAKAYRKVSSEVYDEPPAGSPAGCKGKMLRRVALLGGELPQIKTLADLPQPTGFADISVAALFADLPSAQAKCHTTPVTGWTLGKATRHQRANGSFTVFYEVQTMDRAAMTTALLAAGWSQDEIDAIKDDAALGVVVAHCMKPAGGAPAPEPAEPASDNADMPAPDVMIQDLVAMGAGTAEELAMLSPEDLAALWQEKKGATMADPTPAAVVQATPRQPSPAPTAPAIPSGQPSKIIMQYNEARNQLKSIQDQIAASERLSKKRLEDEKRATVDTFCERMVKAGKLLPAELETGLKAMVLSLDASKPRKFAEDAEAITDLDRWMKSVEARPVLVKFGDKMQNKTAGSVDEELAKVKRFSEDPRLIKAMQASGKTPDQYVAAFVEAKKKLPSLTAADYGVTPEYAA